MHFPVALNSEFTRGEREGHIAAGRSDGIFLKRIFMEMTRGDPVLVGAEGSDSEEGGLDARSWPRELGC